ncbi:YdcF family protein [Furfurilactobacillus sp. WILCCON 0119]
MSIILVLLVFIIMMSMFVMRRPNFWIGSILSLSVLIFMIFLAWRLLLLVLNAVSSWSIIAGLILLAVIVLAFVAVAIYFIWNTSVMSTREGRSFTGKLSAIFGVNLLILIPLFLGLISSETVVLKIIFAILFWEDIFLSLLFFSYINYSALNQLLRQPKNVDYFIVLGSWSGRNDVIPALLKGRVDNAIIHYRRDGSSAKFVVSGGQGPDEEKSEAAVMAAYLRSQGIEDRDILVEDKSRTTLENMRFSKKLIDQDWSRQQPPVIVFSTNNYHVLRASIYAKKAGLNATGIGSPTSFYFLPSALLREFVALLVLYKKTTVTLLSVIALVLIWSFTH